MRPVIEFCLEHSGQVVIVQPSLHHKLDADGKQCRNSMPSFKPAPYAIVWFHITEQVHSFCIVAIKALSRRGHCDRAPFLIIRLMASNDERCVHQTSSATVQVGNSKLSNCSVQLLSSEIRFVQDGNIKSVISISQMCSIEVHQPLFGANYISGEYIEQGSKRVLTITFNKGGATEFATAFFRITEGKLVSTESTAIPEPSELHQSVDADKKNV